MIRSKGSGLQVSLDSWWQKKFDIDYFLSFHGKRSGQDEDINVGIQKFDKSNNWEYSWKDEGCC